MFTVKPVNLSSDRIMLSPLTLDHSEAFHRAANFADIWHWVRANPCTTVAATRLWIEEALAEQQADRQVPFVIIDKSTGTLVGSTRYLSIDAANRGLEIGHTFITPAFHRTFVNRHAKYCLLQHAFEQLGAIRVQFKTHEHNQRSRTAITRMGACFEGIARQQRILPDGKVRNTAIFSIIDSEWPTIKSQLLSNPVQPMETIEQ